MHPASRAPVLRWQVARVHLHQQAGAGFSLAWCRFFALVVRLKMALYAKDEARAEIYVDDPVVTLMGTLAARRCMQDTFVLVWRALNLQLSYAKGQLGRKVTWIGCVIGLVPEGVTATEADNVTELKSWSRTHDACNGVPRRWYDR